MAIDTNSLYQMIQDNATQAEGIKTAALNAPTFENQFGTTLKEQDKTLSGAIGAYGDKVAELFAHDKYVADNWSQSSVPTNLQPEGFIEDPYAKSKASANLYAQKGAEVGASLKNLETRKAILGELIQKAVGIYDAAVTGKKLDLDAKEREFADTLAVYKQVKDEEQQGKQLALDYAKLKGQGSYTGDSMIDSMTGDEAVSEVRRLFGNTVASNLGGTKDERYQRAKDILAGEKTGTLSINELLTQKEVEDRNEATASLISVGISKGIFSKFKDKGASGGTGPLAALIPDQLAGDEAKRMREAITSVTTKMQKFYSGVAISAPEMVRLEGFLPAKKYDEKTNYERLDRLEKGMRINQDIFDAARLTGKTTDQILYSEIGRKIFEKHGEKYPYSSGGFTESKYKIQEKK